MHGYFHEDATLCSQVAWVSEWVSQCAQFTFWVMCQLSAGPLSGWCLWLASFPEPWCTWSVLPFLVVPFPPCWVCAFYIPVLKKIAFFFVMLLPNQVIHIHFYNCLIANNKLSHFSNSVKASLRSKSVSFSIITWSNIFKFPLCLKLVIGMILNYS